MYNLFELFITAFASSLLTLIVLLIFYRFYLRKIIFKEIDGLSEKIKVQVHNGINEGIVKFINPQNFPNTAMNIVKKGSSIVEQGLNILLGGSDIEK